MRVTYTLLIILTLTIVGCSSQNEIQHLADEHALGPYSAAVLMSDFVFVSGQIGERGDTFEHEVQTALANVVRHLSRAGADIEDVVAVTVYLTDIGLYGEFNQIYRTVFREPYPARAVVGVAGLPGDARVEIQVIAQRRDPK